MTTQLSKYIRALLYFDLKEIVTESFAVTDTTSVTGAALFRSESKGSGFHAIERAGASSWKRDLLVGH